MDIDRQKLINQGQKDDLLLDTVCQEQENLEKVKELIEAGSDVNSINWYSHMTALTYSICRNHHDTIKFLLEKNARVDIPTFFSYQSPLMLAIKYQNPIWIIQLLIEKVSDLDHKDCDDYTALDQAIENGYIEAVYCLLRAKSYDEIEAFSKISTENAEIVSGLLEYDRKTLCSIMLSNKLESQLIPEITNYVIQILAARSTSSRIGHLSKWYMASPCFEKDITVFMDIIRQKREQKLAETSPLIFSSKRKRQDDENNDEGHHEENVKRRKPNPSSR